MTNDRPPCPLGTPPNLGGVFLGMAHFFRYQE
jgi:hypothetical protein